jgi:hypothetical protein
MSLKKLTDVYIQQLIENQSELSDTSKISYICTLKKLIAIVKFDSGNLIELKNNNINVLITNEQNFKELLTKPDIYLEKIRENVENTCSFISILKFIVKIIKLLQFNDTNNKKILVFVQKWQLIYKNEFNNQNSYKDYNLSIIDWNDVIDKQLELEQKSLGSNNTLLLSFLCLIPPYKSKDLFNIKLNPNEVDNKNFINYNETKTFLTINKNTFEIPQKLNLILKKNLETNPNKKFLFNTKKNIPFENNNKGINSFIKLINRDLSKIFDKNITINMLRTSYCCFLVKKYKNNEITLKELKNKTKEISYNDLQKILSFNSNEIFCEENIETLT